jgi:poly(A) polymerase
MLLPTLSAERVAQELLRLLSVADPVPALRMMREDGVLAVILPEATRLDRLQALLPLEPTPDPVRRLAGLVDVDAAGVALLAERLHLSNAMRDRLAGLAPPWPLDPAGDKRERRRELYRLGAERVRDLALLLAAEGRLDREKLALLLACASAWETPRFPIAGRDVTALGIPPGPRIGRLLGAVRSWWEEGDFRADRAACLARLTELIEQEGRPDFTGGDRRNRDDGTIDAGRTQS